MANKSIGNLSKYILKNSKNRENNLKYDFMPSLLEIIERPTHVAGRIIVLAITVLLIIAILWAYLAKIDVVVSGIGSITTEVDVGIVASQTSGVVKKLYVSEGDYVKKGDILLEFDTSEIDLQIEQLEKELDFCKVQREVLYQFVSDVDAKVQVDDYDEKYKYVVNNIIYENELYKFQREQSFMNSDISKIQYEAGLNERIITIEQQIRSYQEQLEKQKLLLEDMVIKAQTTGYILSSSVSYEGQVLIGFDELFVIVPDESKYVFEGYILDKDVADVSIGDVVQIKLQSYSFSDYGAVTGTISYISSSTISVGGIGNVYVIRAVIDEEHLHKDIELMSGLSGSIEINIGKRSVLDYFMEPIIGDLENSLSEK